VVQSSALAAHNTDDGFHEIQLNGKQLVFLFMAATVVSVVIFLCGVLVGRGVRVDRAAQETAAAATATDATVPQVAATVPPPAAGSDPTAAATPPPDGEDLTYFNRLEKEKTPLEQLKPKGTTAPAAEKTLPVAESRPASAPRPKDAVPASQPASSSWTVQIAALNERNAADAIAKRLATKGYAAYVSAPTDGTTVYRVRVGRFGSRHEAESLKTRLEKEEQFKPFVTR